MIIKTNTEKISQFWVLGIVLIYSLIMAEFFHTVNTKIISIQGFGSNSSLFSYIAMMNFVIMVLVAFVVWQISSFLFHMFAILLGGTSSYNDFQKYSGLIYIFPTIGFLIALFLFEGIELPKSNIEVFLESNKSMSAISLLINISSSLCFVLLIPIIKYLYHINWLKAIGVIAIPIGSIYLLGQFFATYVV